MQGIFENFRVALIGLGSNKLRSFLTMLGITIGVASVTVLVSLGQAVDNFVRTQFLGLGTNLIIVFGGEDENGIATRLTLRDADALDDPFRVPDALTVMPQRVLNIPARSDTRETAGRIRGVPETYLDVRAREILVGNFFTREDVEASARVAVLGVDTADRLFPNEQPIGQEIRVGDVQFEVIGIMTEIGGTFAGNEDDLIVVPITTALTRLSGERILSGDRPITNILVQARDPQSIQSAASQIREVLREERDISFRAEDDFQIFTQTDLLATSQNITGILTIFLAVIAGISLLVGGIGIMNIMLVTVTERTREIGLRKAVGAQRGDIVFQFLTEATVISVIGGAVGVAIALGGALLVTSLVPDLAVTIRANSVLLATAISIGIGVFFGIYPANRAAALNPIDALRYE
jgi:putative ABC transport system permease protein